MRHTSIRAHQTPALSGAATTVPFERRPFTAMKFVSSILLSVFVLIGVATAAPMTNADVIKLLEAQMPEEVVLASIEKHGGAFDTSAEALVELKNKGASPGLLRAMMNAGATGTSAAAKEPAAETEKKVLVGPVLRSTLVALLEGDKESYLMQQLIRTREQPAAIGVGRVLYAVIYGPQAGVRTRNPSPSFLVSVPTGLEPQHYVYLVRCTRSGSQREFMLGTALVGKVRLPPFSELPKSIREPLTFEKMPEQARAADGFVIYRASAKNALNRGEYVLAIQTVEGGPADAFPGLTDGVLFEFGVNR